MPLVSDGEGVPATESRPDCGIDEYDLRFVPCAFEVKPLALLADRMLEVALA